MRVQNRIAATLTSLSLLLGVTGTPLAQTLLPLAQTTASATETLTTEDGFSYTVANDAVTITNYTGKATAVVIPAKIDGKPVTTIGYHAFSKRTDITSVTIPDSVTMIEAAFSGCSSLTSVNIPDSVTTINGDALLDTAIYDDESHIENDIFYLDGWAMKFVGSDVPKTLTLADETRGIATNAFAADDCKRIATLVIPKNVMYIGANALDDFLGLKSIQVSSENKTFSSVDGILYNKERTTIVRCPQAYTGVLTIPDGVTQVGDYAFRDCSKLTSITFPDGMTELGTNTFFDCSSLTSFSIPYSVKTIYVCAFNGCDGLNDIYSSGYKLDIAYDDRVRSSDDYEEGRTYEARMAELKEFENRVEVHYSSSIPRITNLRNISGNSFQWDEISNAVQYNIYVNGIKCTKTTNNFYTFQNFHQGSFYAIGVSAILANGMETRVGTTSWYAKYILAKPTGLKRNGNTLRWNKVDDAAKYCVYVIDAKTLKITAVNAKVNGTSYTFKSLKPGKQYKLRVCAVDPYGVRGKSVTTRTFTAE